MSEQVVRWPILQTPSGHLVSLLWFIKLTRINACVKQLTRQLARPLYSRWNGQDNARQAVAILRLPHHISGRRSSGSTHIFVKMPHMCLVVISISPSPPMFLRGCRTPVRTAVYSSHMPEWTDVATVATVATCDGNSAHLEVWWPCSLPLHVQDR